MPKEIATYLLPIVVLAIVGLRMMRQSRGRPLKPSRLWIRPAILAVFLAIAFSHPPTLTLLSIAIFASAAVLGVGLGYVLASHQHLTIDPVTGTITSKTSPVGIALFLGLFAARYVFRMVTLGGQAPDRLMAHSDQVLMWTDAGLFFVLGLVSAQAWEIWRRVKPLLDGHAAKKAESQV
jgi:hypothetical protein